MDVKLDLIVPDSHIFDAENAFQKVISDLLIEKASEAMDCLDWSEAASHWKKLRELFPDNQMGYCKGTVALRNNKLFDESDEVMNNAIKRFGEQANLLLVKSDTARDKGDWNEAAQRFAHFRSLYPNNLQAILGEIEALLFGGKLLEARERNEDAIKIFGKRDELVLQLIRILQALGEFKLTENLYEEFFQSLDKQLYISPDFLPSFLYLELESIIKMKAYIKDSQISCDVENSIISNKFNKNHIKSSSQQKNKVLIASVPKAGTHLLSKVLTLAGCPFNGLFLNGDDCVIELNETFGSNRVHQYQDVPNYPKEFINRLSINTYDALSLLREGEHCMCHFPPKAIPTEWIDCLKIIVIFRNPKDSLASEFLTEYSLFNTKRPYCYDKELECIFVSNLPLEKMFQAWLIRYSSLRSAFYKDMLEWCNVNSALCIRYEDILGSTRHLKIDNVINFINNNLDIELGLDAFNKPNPTQSNYRINKNDLWTKAAKEIYSDSDFISIEKKILTI